MRPAANRLGVPSAASTASGEYVCHELVSSLKKAALPSPAGPLIWQSESRKPDAPWGPSGLTTVRRMVPSIPHQVQAE